MPSATRFFSGDDEPQGLGGKLLRINWLLVALLTAAAAVGFLMLYSVAGGDLDRWARPQILRFTLGFGVMILVALIDIRVWRSIAVPLYALSLLLLIGVELFGTVGMGAKRWLVLGPLRIQPSELMKLALVMVLALYYQRLSPEKISRPFWIALPLLIILVPAVLVAKQPDLGTALLLIAGGGLMMMLAGVAWWFFALVGTLGISGIVAVFMSRGTNWQLLKDYQFRRIETFLDPSQDPLGSGYHITQSMIAIGSGGVTGKGYLKGTQTHLSFMPEAHTDFIYPSLAEEFGLLGSLGLLGLYMGIVFFAMLTALTIRSTFGRLVAMGVSVTFFFYFAINMAMVMGLAPVVGVPLPLVSFGGTSMLVILFGFGLLLSAKVHSRSRR
ncbi:MAG: rod shape-determining protein RodA [Neomegalonema sp.]|nr:rod shape-determining protein RodA [Neomegalonema sp.]